MHNYLFGTPALPRPPSTSSKRDWFVLGAYPSALHVKWTPPTGKPISAVAVADEPEPFWDGQDQDGRIRNWERSLPWNPAWGSVSTAGKLNGPSGVWIRDLLLTPLRLRREETWITDCLDLYHESSAIAKRLNERRMQSMLTRLQIPDRRLPSHPSPSQIVSAAQIDRLRAEFAACAPKHVITLGNAALAVFSIVAGVPIPISRLTADRRYGRVHKLLLQGGSLELLPLAHPGAPKEYKQAHLRWAKSQMRAA